jgi:hypothetical protein
MGKTSENREIGKVSAASLTVFAQRMLQIVDFLDKPGASA